MRWLQRQKLLLLALVLINVIFLWYISGILQVNNQDSHPRNVQVEVQDVTIVLPEFESFDHDVVATVSSFCSASKDTSVLVITENFPYPYFELPDGKAKFIITEQNADRPASDGDPLRFIHSQLVAIVHDGVHLKSSLTDLLQEYRRATVKALYDVVLVVPHDVATPKCHVVDVDLKTWTLKYSTDTIHPFDGAWECSYLETPHVMIMKSSLLSNLTQAFHKPFYEGFFIQAKLRGWKIGYVQSSTITLGKRLFQDEHKKWKLDTAQEERRKKMYKRFGIKRAVFADGREMWFGCSKTSARCFPSVDDIPSYLYEKKWTPPCCLKALRETARHVFRALEEGGVRYWLEGGSLLGAARNGDIIPWDYDVDLGIFMQDISKLQMLEDVWKGKKQIDEDGFVWERASEGDFMRVQYSQVNHMHVDIFPFYEKDGKMTKDTWFKTHRQDMEFPAEYLHPLNQISFVGVKASVPNRYREFLEMKFGPGVIQTPMYPFPEKLKKIYGDNE